MLHACCRNPNIIDRNGGALLTQIVEQLSVDTSHIKPNLNHANIRLFKQGEQMRFILSKTIPTMTTAI